MKISMDIYFLVMGREMLATTIINGRVIMKRKLLDRGKRIFEYSKEKVAQKLYEYRMYF